jgi:serine/threonine protein kinase
MAAAWQKQQALTAAEVLARHPGASSDAALRLIYEEVCLRREAGETVDTTEVVGRYPRWGDSLRSLLDADRLFRPSFAREARVAAMPGPGDTLGHFQLLNELGRGASGRTFLATDPGLADRPVVLKVMTDDQAEHLALAQLRHTHIVPLFSEHVFPDRGLRALCMPDLGGADLARVLRDVADQAPHERSGRAIMEAVDRHARRWPAPPPGDGPYRRSLEQATYVQAVVWIAACLADALSYAHARGLVHMDVKPSNVLITGDGQPILLDFHLARAPLDAAQVVDDRMGGTPGWMSPEQAQALDSVARGEPLPQAIDGRSDIYALGLLLQHALYGSQPGGLSYLADAAPPDAPQAVSPDAHALRAAGVSLSLADLIRRCVAARPEDRYPDAASLADDLRRHLQGLPLRGVRNRSVRERVAKWRQRHPTAVAWSAAAAALGLAALVGLGSVAVVQSRRHREVEHLVDAARRDRLAGRPAEAVAGLEHARGEATRLLWPDRLQSSIDAELALAVRARGSAELRAFADSVRTRHALQLPDAEPARELLAACDAIWQHRRELVPTDPAVARDPANPTRADLIELVAIWTDLKLDSTLTPAEREAAQREAIARIDEAEALLGPSFALNLRRRSWTASPSGTFSSPPPRPQTPWEHHDLGRHLLREGHLAEAQAQFHQAVEARPDDSWSHFYEGMCLYRLGHFAEAESAFRTAVALAPASPVARHNRALCRAALGQIDAALDDDSRALEIDPNLIAARLHRGELSLLSHRPAIALDDFSRALHHPSLAPEARGRVLYNLALAQRDLGLNAEFRASAEAARRLGVAEAESLAR